MTSHPTTTHDEAQHDNQEHSVRVPFADEREARARLDKIHAQTCPPRFRDHADEIEAMLDGTWAGRRT